MPGSKSVTNRALVLAALASEPGWLRRPLRSRDTLLMAEALRAMGVGIEETASAPERRRGEAWRVIPAGLHGPATVDVGNAGTVMRFLPPVAALADGPIRFDGDPRSYERPLHGVIDALRVLGARIDDDGRGALPLTVHGGGRAGRRPGGDRRLLVLPVRVAPCCSPRRASTRAWRSGTSARTLPSMPHIRMTVDMLRAVGAQVDDPGVGRRAERLAGHAGRAARPRPDRRAGSVQRPAVPGGGPGDRRQGHHPRLARAHHPAR